jgi:hypothetical protein
LELMTASDPARLGGLEWARRTGGSLSRSERRTLLAAIVRGQGDYLATRWRRMTGRVPAGARELAFADVQPPDSRLARLAEEAAEEQSVHVKGHGYRTWAFGTAFAMLDRNEPDPEVFYVASLLHDYGIADAVPGEDFVLRSATRAETCVADAELGEAIALATADAISVHSTPGITPEMDGPGFYVGAGAGVDLAALRCGDLPRSYFDGVHAAHPRDGVTRAFVDHIAAEARANPDGRFAQLRRCGFNLLLRANPLDRG